ncbi:MAG: hypothetical protein O2960_13900 [Verrucomicrobia bacterium]|nr:hypothetical protein [Verrucomicrobiota bacterium]
MKTDLRTSTGKDSPTLVSLGGATLREALTSPCWMGILQIGAVETPDCLDVSAFPVRLVVRIFRRKVD